MTRVELKAVITIAVAWMLATPLIVALFAILPALAESRMNQTGMIVLLAIFAATWLSMFQLRVYAICYPAPQPAGIQAGTH